MNEIVFIEENRLKWERLAKATKGELSLAVSDVIQLYEHTADDLSYARTHYPDSKVVGYLNTVCVNAHRMVYKNQYGDWSRFIDYFRIDIPVAVWTNRMAILWAICAFIGSIILGWTSSMIDSDFTRLILGDSYVNMTINNIENEDPMAVYGEMQSGNMFLAIGVNNIRVAFFAFVLGIFTFLGPLYILFRNGIMVGTFFYFFYERGLTVLTWTTIMIHGTLELAAICIAGGAGIVLGKSFLFPGTYARGRALVQGTRDGLKIMVGLIPVFITAAFLEGYFTRAYLTLGLLGRSIIIILSLAFLLWYFYFYAKRVYNEQHPHEVL